MPECWLGLYHMLQGCNPVNMFLLLWGTVNHLLNAQAPALESDGIGSSLDSVTGWLYSLEQDISLSDHNLLICKMGVTVASWDFHFR